MTRKNRKRRQIKPPAHVSAPKVHVKVAAASADLRGVTRLVKPAILYADHVTIYSPAASMVHGVVGFTRIKDPRDRAAAAFEVIQAVPALAEQLTFPASTLEKVKSFLSLSPAVARRLGTAYGAEREVAEFYDNLNSIWEGEFPQALKEIREDLGADDLLHAVDAKAVKVADLDSRSSTDTITDAVNAASGSDHEAASDDLVTAFLACVVEMLSEGRSFPLLDAESSGLVRALEQVVALEVSSDSIRRGREVTSAASFMGFLPYFPELPMDEVLDLRRVLRVPLVRFRGAITNLSRDFECRPTDEEFDAEVEDAWRRDVAPTLADIRESLAEHGLLKETASVVLGDPRRLVAEAGGVFAAAHAPFASLSTLLTAGLTAGIPVADILGRALRVVLEARRESRSNTFYFLHRLDTESARRTRR